MVIFNIYKGYSLLIKISIQKEGPYQSSCGFSENADIF